MNESVIEALELMIPTQMMSLRAILGKSKDLVKREIKPTIELKSLLSCLKHAYLEDNSKPIIIFSSLQVIRRINCLEF